MTRVLSRQEIDSAVAGIDLVRAMELAFVAYSRGQAVIPPVGELLFSDPPGEAHIKYGYLNNSEIFVIKVATGFYGNSKIGKSPNSGVVLVFDRRSGFPLWILLDEGTMTDLRTGAAGAVAAKHLGGANPRELCVLGSGVQARLQMRFLKQVTRCRRVRVWARRKDAAAALSQDLEGFGYEVSVAATPADATRDADIIVTTTASDKPLLIRGDVKPGALVVAVGSDTPHKQELHALLVGSADVVVADSRSQCAGRGEIHHALEAGLLTSGRVAELGEVIGGERAGRRKSTDLVIVDLTGVAVQDIAIADAVIAHFRIP